MNNDRGVNIYGDTETTIVFVIHEVYSSFLWYLKRIYEAGTVSLLTFYVLQSDGRKLKTSILANSLKKLGLNC